MVLTKRSAPGTWTNHKVSITLGSQSPGDSTPVSPVLWSPTVGFSGYWILRSVLQSVPFLLTRSTGRPPQRCKASVGRKGKTTRYVICLFPALLSSSSARGARIGRDTDGGTDVQPAARPQWPLGMAGLGATLLPQPPSPPRGKSQIRILANK